MSDEVVIPDSLDDPRILPESIIQCLIRDEPGAMEAAMAYLTWIHLQGPAIRKCREDSKLHLARMKATAKERSMRPGKPIDWDYYASIRRGDQDRSMDEWKAIHAAAPSRSGVGK